MQQREQIEPEAEADTLEVEIEAILDEYFHGGEPTSPTSAAIVAGNCRLIDEGQHANETAD